MFLELSLCDGSFIYSGLFRNGVSDSGGVSTRILSGTSAGNPDVFWKNYGIHPGSVFSVERGFCTVLRKMVLQVWYPICYVRTFWNTSYIKSYTDLYHLICF